MSRVTEILNMRGNIQQPRLQQQSDLCGWDIFNEEQQVLDNIQCLISCVLDRLHCDSSLYSPPTEVWRGLCQSHSLTLSCQQTGEKRFTIFCNLLNSLVFFNGAQIVCNEIHNNQEKRFVRSSMVCEKQSSDTKKGSTT